MSKKLSKLIQLGIVGIWLCLVATLVYLHFISGAQISSLQSVTAKQFKTSEEWFGVYNKGEKIGHLKTTSEKIGDEYRFVQHSEVEIVSGGVTVKNVVEFSCLTDLEYGIKSFEFESRSGDSYFKATGDIDETNMLLAYLESQGQKKTWAEQLQSQPYHPLSVKHMLYARGFEKGKKLNIPVLDALSFKAEQVLTEVVDLMPVKLGSMVNTVYLLDIGGNRSWITDGGSTLKEETVTGYTYLAGTEVLAKSKDEREIIDFLSMPSFKANKLLAYPEELTYLKARLSGVDLSRYPLLDEGRQSFKDGVLHVRKESEDEMKDKSYELPYGNKDLLDFLASTAFVQSHHHTIRYNAEKFVTIEKSSFNLSRFLTSNLYLSMVKSPMFQLRTSMEIFNDKAGESADHTVLFTAFARAAGMPVRMVGGMVYVGGHFYFHSWPEVWLDGWVPVDPTMGQFPADVAHIRLVEGDIDEIVSIGTTLKDIRIDIMEAL